MPVGDRLEQVGPDLLSRLAVHRQAFLVLKRPDRTGDDHVVRAFGPEGPQHRGVTAVPAESPGRRDVRGRQLLGRVRRLDRGPARRPGQRQVTELGEQLFQPQGGIGPGRELADEPSGEVAARARLGPGGRAHPGRAGRDAERHRGVLGVPSGGGEDGRAALDLPGAGYRGGQLGHRGAVRQRRREADLDGHGPIDVGGAGTRCDRCHLQRRSRMRRRSWREDATDVVRSVVLPGPTSRTATPAMTTSAAEAAVIRTDFFFARGRPAPRPDATRRNQSE